MLNRDVGKAVSTIDLKIGSNNYSKTMVTVYCSLVLNYNKPFEVGNLSVLYQFNLGIH